MSNDKCLTQNQVATLNVARVGDEFEAYGWLWIVDSIRPVGETLENVECYRKHRTKHYTYGKPRGFARRKQTTNTEN